MWIVINGAASQYDRLLRALRKGYAPVDGRSLAQLLDFSVQFGGLINFYNARDEIDGDWTNFFLTDPVMILASIEAIDLSRIEARFARLERLTAEARYFDPKFDLLRQTFRVILDTARQVNLWLEGLDLTLESETARLLREEIGAAIEGDLGPQLRLLKSYDEGAGLPTALRQPIGLDYDGFLPIWDLKNVLPDGSIYRGIRRTRKIDRALPHLNPILRAFMDAISDWKTFPEANLSPALQESDHKPQIALYIAYAKLFQTAQDTINTMSRRYAQFYYQDVLRGERLGPFPDSVYLNFTLAEEEGVADELVPRGTLFPAGQDLEGQDILYGWDSDLVVTAAQIADLRTLQVIRGGLILGEEGQEPQLPQENGPPRRRVIRRVTSTRVFVSEEVEEEAMADEETGSVPLHEPTSWATFGESRAGTTESETTEAATLGFAVASQYLLLTGGRRIVRLKADLSEAYRDDVLAPLLEELSTVTGLGETAVFRQILEGAFRLFASTATGWFAVDKYEIVLPDEESDYLPNLWRKQKLTEIPNWFEISFTLPESAPPLVAFDPEAEPPERPIDEERLSDDPAVNASNPAPTLPTLKTYVRQQPVLLSGDAGEALVYPLSLLAEMAVDSMQIGARVVDLADLLLSNTDGEIDPSSPFTVFGAQPVVGSYLRIAQEELFVKTVETLKIRIAWFNLPPNKTGFKGYYKDYVIGLSGHREPNLFHNGRFKGAWSVRNPGRWFLKKRDSSPCPEAPPPPVSVFLFRTEENCLKPVPTPAGTLCADTRFDDLKVCPKPLPNYYQPQESSVQLTLTGPDYAFGNDLYAVNVLNSVVEDLPDVDECEARCAAECGILLEASQCLEDCKICLLSCEQTSDGYSDCVKECLTVCVQCLARLFLHCLAGRVSAERHEKLKTSIQDSLQASGAERARLVQQILQENKGLEERERGEGSALGKCFALLEAIVCVASCDAECRAVPSQPYAECMAGCLDGCLERLGQAHADCLQACLENCVRLKQELKYPNQPYLPEAQSVSLEYQAACSVPAGEGGKECGLLFRLWPFGGSDRIRQTKEMAILPQFPQAGELYLGFSALTPPQTLTLLFQMTGDPAADLPEPAWSYLSDNRWTRLKDSQILGDSTNGLQNSGLIALKLPTYNPDGNTILSPDRQWLRASVERKADRFPRTMGLFPHAGLSTWRNSDNTGENLRQPLPAHTITSSVEDLPNIALINQPMESFGGRAPETESEFEIRLGERLRHKDRADLGWDYDRLTLERFPSIWKVKTLPARSLDQGRDPGHVLVVVVPGPDSIEVVDPTAPTAPSHLLQRIEEYLRRIASPFVELKVVNPAYVRIEVTAEVEFVAGQQSGAGVDKLNADLVAYLSPWYYDAARAAKGGRYASESDISEFIQNRPYVAALWSISFLYAPDPEQLSWCFLTSARQHQIRQRKIGPPGEECC